VDQKMHVGGTFCDLAKDFDSTQNEILLLKLNFMAYDLYVQIGLNKII
jgi:hypothetical protein